MTCITRFYLGRPTRGAKLKFICAVIHHTPTFYPQEGIRDDFEPWKRDDYMRPMYIHKGWHAITRQIKKAGGKP